MIASCGQGFDPIVIVTLKALIPILKWRYPDQQTCMAIRCRLEFNLYRKNCRSMAQCTNWFVTDIWQLYGNKTCRHLHLLPMVRFSLKIRIFYTLLVKNKITFGQKFFASPKIGTPVHLCWKLWHISRPRAVAPTTLLWGRVGMNMNKYLCFYFQLICLLICYYGGIFLVKGVAGVVITAIRYLAFSFIVGEFGWFIFYISRTLQTWRCLLSKYSVNTSDWFISVEVFLSIDNKSQVHFQNIFVSNPTPLYICKIGEVFFRWIPKVINVVFVSLWIVLT